MIIYKLDAHGREVLHYPAEALYTTPHVICLEAFLQRDDRDLGYTVLKRNDRFIEYFYSQRWYNIFAVHDRDTQALKGWYCNICRPSTWDAGAVRCEDLALDIWVHPDGRTLVLDEDEFEALDLPPHEKAAATAALDALLELAHSGQLPTGPHTNNSQD